MLRETRSEGSQCCAGAASLRRERESDGARAASLLRERARDVRAARERRHCGVRGASALCGSGVISA